MITTEKLKVWLNICQKIYLNILLHMGRFYQKRTILEKSTEDCVTLWAKYGCLEVLYSCSSFILFFQGNSLNNVKCLTQLLLFPVLTNPPVKARITQKPYKPQKPYHIKCFQVFLEFHNYCLADTNYDVMKTSGLRPLEDVWFAMS